MLRIGRWNKQRGRGRNPFGGGLSICYLSSVFIPSKMFRYDFQTFNWSSWVPPIIVESQNRSRVRFVGLNLKVARCFLISKNFEVNIFLNYPKKILGTCMYAQRGDSTPSKRMSEVPFRGILAKDQAFMSCRHPLIHSPTIIAGCIERQPQFGLSNDRSSNALNVCVICWWWLQSLRDSWEQHRDLQQHEAVLIHSRIARSFG